MMLGDHSLAVTVVTCLCAKILQNILVQFLNILGSGTDYYYHYYITILIPIIITIIIIPVIITIDIQIIKYQIFKYNFSSIEEIWYTRSWR